jgi:hypothetical protein
MAGAGDPMRARIEAWPWPPRRGGVAAWRRGGVAAWRRGGVAAWRRGGVEVVRANRGYTLYSLRTGAPVARLRPAGKGDDVQVLWWRRGAWGNPGPFGREVMPLDEALEFIASEGFFWIHAP